MTDAASGARSAFLPAHSGPLGSDSGLLHTGNAGFIIHRAGQLNHAFRAQGREFATDLVGHLNKVMEGIATIVVHEEILGTADRLHWLIHMKQPNDYSRFLEVADHDRSFKEITEADRIAAAEGAGNWERMFVEGSFKERVYVPQHGLDEHDDDHGHDDHHEASDTFVPPARHQTGLPDDQMRSSVDSGLTILRTAQTAFKFRTEAREFAFAWAREVNRALAGEATVYLYEETFGQQDRIHWMIHLESFDTYRKLVELSRHDAGYQALSDRQFVPDYKGGGGWEQTFVSPTIQDVVLTPLHAGSPSWF